MHYYPLNVNIKDRLCVVVGGGRVAERKVKTMLAFGADVQVISPDLTEGLQRLVDDGKVSYLQRRYAPDVLAGAFLAFTATNERAVNIRAASDAHALGIPVNVADSAAESTFILPAILQRGSILVAVSTGGRSPALAKRVRDRLSELWEEIAVGIESEEDYVRETG